MTDEYPTDEPRLPDTGPAPSTPEPDRESATGPASDPMSAPTSAPASLKGFLVLIGLLALMTTFAFLLLGDSWRRWFPRS